MLARVIAKEPSYGLNPCSVSQFALRLSGGRRPAVILGWTQPPVTRVLHTVIIHGGSRVGG